jgi:hypothetical protein
MNKHLGFGAAILLGGTALTGVWSQPAKATIDVTVYDGFAPNHHGSPSYIPWAENAIAALTGGTQSASSGPTYFQQAPGTASPSSNIVTNFNSWNGVANPGSPYGSELGNRITFIAVIKDTDGLNDISLSQLTETLTSNSSQFNLLYNWGNSTLTYNNGATTAQTTPDSSLIETYSATQVGILAGGGGTITSGANTQLVNELVVVGWGNALANTGPSCAGAGATQAAIQCVANQYAAIDPVSMAATFSLGGASGSAGIVFTPEPGTLALFGSAVAGLGLLGKRRKKA